MTNAVLTFGDAIKLYPLITFHQDMTNAVLTFRERINTANSYSMI